MRLTLFFLLFSIQAAASVILVSERNGFRNPEELSIHTYKKQLKLGFKPPLKVDPLNHSDWIESIGGQKTLIMIHGYNNDYDEALEFFSNIYAKTARQYDRFICYLWPGYDDFWEYLAAKSLVMNTKLSSRFASLIEEISSHAQQMDIIAFSMGCRVTLEALKKHDQIHVNNLFMMAPAVDNESLERGERYFRSVQNAKNVYVFHSREDGTLTWAYPIAEGDRALGSGGVENPLNQPHVRIVDSSAHIQGHGDYSSSSFIFNIIRDILSSQVDPTHGVATAD